MQLVWRPAMLASGLEVARRMAAGQALASSDLQAQLEPACLALSGKLQSAGLPAESVWRHLIPLSITLDTPRLIAETTVAKVIGHNAHLSAAGNLTRALAEFEAAVRAALPRLGDELPLRVGPLREQWESRGPGLLTGVERRTEDDVLVGRAEVAVVLPAVGGAGAAYLHYNLVTIEGMLANARPELPEIVRLGWLLAQLNCDLPRFSETVNALRLPRVAALALIPPILLAADDVELVRYSPQLVAAALGAWLSDSPSENVDDLSSHLVSWWETYAADRPPWPIALAALDQLLD